MYSAVTHEDLFLTRTGKAFTGDRSPDGDGWEGPASEFGEGGSRSLGSST